MSKRIRKIASVTIAISTTLWLSGAVAVLPAAAQSIQDLLNQIAALQAQLVALQAQQTGGAGACAFTRSLTIGSQGTDVQCLQKYLNSAGYQIAASGVGSPGNETTYFGPLTRAAVAKWQAANVVSPAAGYFGALSRAKYSSIAGGAPGVSPVPVGALAVSVDPLLTGATVVTDSGGSTDGAQALAEVLRLRFSGSARVTQLRIHRIGISNDSDFSNAYLYDGATRIAEAPAVASSYFTFTNSAGLFDVSGTKTISFKVDMANTTAGGGKTFQFGIMAASDVASNAVSVSGAFSFHGPEFRTAQVSDLGKLTLTRVSPTGSTAPSVDPGSTNYEVFRFTGQSADQKIQVSYLKFTVIGTADYDALQNLKLYIDGVQVGSSLSLMNSDKTAAFDLSGSPVQILVGTTKTFSLRGDIVKGAGRDFYFQIQTSADIVAKDVGYGVFIKVNQSDVWTIFRPTDTNASTGSARTTSIGVGSMSVQKATDSTTGPLSKGATNLELAKYDFKAVGEDIKLTNVRIVIATTTGTSTTRTFKNVKLTLDGVQIGSSVSSLDAATNQDFNPGGSFVVPAGVTKKLSVWADLTDATIVDGISIKVTVKTGSSNALRLSAGTTFNVPSSDADANTIAIQVGTLSVTKNASVANVTTVKGASGVVIGSWLITGPSDQAVNVNSVTVNNATGTPGLGSAFDSLTLWSGGAQYGQTINSPSTATDTAQTFNLSTTLNIPAGQSKQVDLKANVITSADTAWAGSADDVVKVTSLNTTGVVTNSAVNFSGLVLGQTINIKAGPGLTVDEEATPTMPNKQYLVTGDTGQTVAAYKFTSDNTEDVRITRVKLQEVNSADKPGNVRNLRLYVDGVQVGATVPAFTVGSPDTALFEDLNGLFTVPRNTSKTLVLKIDVTPKTDASFAAAGAGLTFRIASSTGSMTSTSDVSGKGVTSGTFGTLTMGANCSVGNCDSNDSIVAKTKPTFVLVSPASTTLVPGTVEVFRFRLTAHSDGDVVFGASHNIRFTITASGGTGTVNNFNLYDAATGIVVATEVNGATSSANFTAGLLTTIPANATKEYYVKANLTGFTTVGNSFQLSIKNAAADLSWSDTSNMEAPSVDPDISNADVTGYGLPIDGPIYVKP